MKAVKNYLKNVGKSIGFAAADVGKELMPETGDFIETNKEFFTATYAALRNPSAALKKGIKSIQESKVYQAAVYGGKNAIEDLRTGNFYNKEREDRDSLKFAGLDTDWDDLSEFGIDDDWESNIGKSSDDVSAGDKEIVKSVEATSAASTNTIVNATLISADKQIANQKVSTALMYNQNERLFGNLNNNIGILDNSIKSMHGLLGESLKSIDTNMASFFTEQLKNTKEQTAILKEMLDMQRNMYKSAAQREAEQQDKKGRARYKDIAAGGTPDIKAFFDMVGNNIKKEVSNMGIAGFGEDSNMLATFMTSPFKSLTTGLVRGLIPAVVKEATQELDQTLNGVFGTLMARMANIRDDIGNSNVNPIVKFAARFIAPNTSIRSGIDTSKYERGPVPWDGIARKTLTDVIPKYLRRIEAALTGQPEELFDYKTGKWTTMHQVREAYKNVEKRQREQSVSDVRAGMKPITDSIKFNSKREQDEWEEAQDEFFNDFLFKINGQFNPYASADDNDVPAGSKIRKYYMALCNAYISMDRLNLTNAYGRKVNRSSYRRKMQLGGRILNARDQIEAEYRNMEREGGVYVQYAAASNTFDKHGKWAKEDGKKTESWSDINRLNQLKDSFGNTIYDYLRQINRELEWQRDAWLYAGGGSGSIGSYANNDDINVTAGANPGTFTNSERWGERFKKKNPLKDINSFDMRSDAKKREATGKYDRVSAQNEEYLRKVREKVEKGEWIIYDDDIIKTRTTDEGEEVEELDEEFRKAIENMMAEKAGDEYIGRVRDFANENFMTKHMDKAVYKNGAYTSKEMEDIVKKAEKDAEKKESDDGKEVLDEKEKSFLGRVFEKIAGGGGFVSAFSSAGAESITNVLYAADEAIYSMFFKSEVEGEDKTKYEGFMDMISKKTESTFNSLKDSIDKHILTPFKEKFNELVDPEGEKKDRFLGTIKDAGKKAWTVFKDSNKEVYGSLFNKIKDTISPSKIAERMSGERADKRAQIMSDFEYAAANNNLVDDRYMQILLNYGLNFMDYSSVDEANAELMPILQEEMYRSSNKMKDVMGTSTTDQQLAMMFEYIKANPDQAEKLARSYGFSLDAENKEDIASDFINKFNANYSSDADIRRGRKDIIHGRGDTEEYAKSVGLSGDIDAQIRRLKASGVSSEDINKVMNDVVLKYGNKYSPEELDSIIMREFAKLHAESHHKQYSGTLDEEVKKAREAGVPWEQIKNAESGIKKGSADGTDVTDDLIKATTVMNQRRANVTPGKKAVELSGSISEQAKQLVDAGIPTEYINRVVSGIRSRRGDKSDEEVNNEILTAFAKMNSRGNNANGTFGLPFKGLSALSKNELLFNRKGISKVNKTGVYEVTEPTHILNSEDSYDILKDLGFTDLGPKSTISQDLKKENSAILKVTKHAEGTTGKEKININGKDMTGNEILEEAKKYVPEAAAGGVLGGVVSTLLGFVGGPIIGAAVGSGVSLIAKSDKFKEVLFGKVDDDGNRMGGIVSKSVIDTVKKYAPDALKFGLAGIIPGLLTPLGPLGGMMIGAGIGILKNNEKFTTKYFGENGKLTFNSKEKKTIQKMMPGALVGGGIGAAATLFGGPFGLLGNAAIGSAIGMMVTSTEFKEGVLGKNINGVRVGGILGTLREAFSPIGNTLVNLKDDLIDIIDNKIITPMKDFITPVIHALPRMVGLVPSLIVRFLDRTGIRDTVMEKFEDWVKGPLNKVFNKVLSPVVKLGARVVSLPFQALGAIGNRMTAREIRKGKDTYRTAQEQIDWQLAHGHGEDISDLNIALASMDEEQITQLMTNIAAVEGDKEAAKGNLKTREKAVKNALRNFRTENGEEITNKDVVYDLLTNGDIENAEKELKNLRIGKNGKKGSRTISQTELDTLLNSEDIGLQRIINQYANAYDIYTAVTTSSPERQAQLKSELEKDLEKYGIKDISNKYLMERLDTEKVNRQAHGNPVISDEDKARIQPIVEGMVRITDLLGDIHRAQLDTLTMQNPEMKRANEERKAGIDRALKENEETFNKRKDINRETMGDEVWDQLDEDQQNGYSSAQYGPRQALHTKVTKGKDAANDIYNQPLKSAKTIGKNNIPLETVKQNVDVGGDIERVNKISSLGYFLDESAVSAVAALNDTNFNTLYKNYIVDVEFSKVFKGYTFTEEDINYLAKPGNNIKEYKNYLHWIAEGGYTFKDIGTPKDVDVRNAAIARSNIKQKGVMENFKDETKKDFSGGLFSKLRNKIRGRRARNMNDITGGVVPGSAKERLDWEEGVEPQPVEEAAEPIEQNGVGTFLLNMAGKAASGIGRAAWSGVKGLARNTAEMFLPSQVMQGYDTAIDAMKAAKNGIGSVRQAWADSKDSGLDEVDKKGDGKDIVQIGDKFARVETKSDGSVELDTSDSQTKEIVDELEKEKSTNEKVVEAQLEQAENIKKAFDTTDVEGSKKGKISWLALLFGGAILLKSGVLQKLFDNVIKPIWTNHLKPWLTDKVAPWITDKAIPAVATAIGNLLKEILPGLIKIGVNGIGTLLNRLFGDKDKDYGNDRTVDSTEQTGASGFYDENGNEYTYEQIAAGEAGDTVYNARGEVGAVDENGVVTVEDTTSVWETPAKKAGNWFVRGFLRGTSGPVVKAVSKASGTLLKASAKLAKNGRFGMAATSGATGALGKVITAPSQLGAKLSQKMQSGLVKASTTKVAEAATEAGENLVTNTGNLSQDAINALKNGKTLTRAEDGAVKVADDVVETAAEKSSTIAKVLAKVKEFVSKGLSKLAENNRFIKRVADAAGELGQEASKFSSKFITKVSSVFDNAAETACKKLGTKTLKEAMKKLNAIATVVMVIVDFATGCDQAETILGVTEPTKLETLVCGVVRALCNLVVVPAMIPGENWIAQKICGLFDSDLATKQEETDAEYEKYIEETHSTESESEWLKHNYSVTGKLGQKIKGAAKSVGGIVKKAAGTTVKVAWNTSPAGIVSNLVKNIKNYKKANKEEDADALVSDDTNTEDGSGGALTNMIKSLFIPGYGINLALKSIVGNHSKIADAFDRSDTEDKIQQVKDGKLTIFDKEYWKVEEADDDDETGFGSTFNRAYNWMSRLLNAPTLLIRSLATSFSDGLGNIGDWISEKFSNVKSFFQHPIQFIYNKIMGNDDDSDNVDSTSNDETWWTKLKNKIGIGNNSSGTGTFGRGYVKQTDPSVANIPFNISRDTTKQTIGDSGCGPAAAVNAVRAAYGRGSDELVSASQYALNGGYKEPDGGTYPQFFTDYFSDNGLGSTATDNKSELINNIKSGYPTVLMGQDSNGVSSSTPYGSSPHYVTATGVDSNNRVIVQDPESKYDNQLYDMNDLISKTSFGVSAFGKRFGRGRRLGRAWAGRGRFGRGLAKGESIAIPDGLGSLFTYMGWQCITSPTSTQVKLRNQAGQNFNSEGFGIINGRYVIACTTTYGNVGDYVDFVQSDGTVFNCVIGDIKNQSDSGCNEWGHQNGAVIVEFVVDKSSWYSPKHANPGTDSFHPEWKNKTMVSCTNYGSYFDDPTGESISSVTLIGNTTSTSTTDSEESDATSSVVSALTDVLMNSEAGQLYSKILGVTSGSSDSDSSTTSTSTTSTTSYSSDASVTDQQNELVSLLDGIKGTLKYSMSGARDPDKGSADCSSTVNWAYKKVFGESVGNSTVDMLNNSNTVVIDQPDSGLDTSGVSNSSGPHIDKLQPGDIVLLSRPTSNFTKGRKYRIGHVEMYYGNNQTIGHGSDGGPTIKDMSKNSKYYIEAKRYKTLVSGTGVDSNIKPISKYGTFKRNLSGNGSLGDVGDEGLPTYNAYNNLVTKVEKDRNKPNQTIYVNNTGKGTNISGVNLEALLKAIIQVLTTIADNSDKLNTIVNLISEKTGMEVTSQDVSNATSISSTKDAITSALSAIASSSSTTNVMNDNETNSMATIINMLNSIASE